MSAACCTGHYRHTNMFITIHFDDGKVSEGLYASVHCLITMCTKLRVQNKMLEKIN